MPCRSPLWRDPATRRPTTEALGPSRATRIPRLPGPVEDLLPQDSHILTDRQRVPASGHGGRRSPDSQGDHATMPPGCRVLTDTDSPGPLDEAGSLFQGHLGRQSQERLRRPRRSPCGNKFASSVFSARVGLTTPRTRPTRTRGVSGPTGGATSSVDATIRDTLANRCGCPIQTMPTHRAHKPSAASSTRR